MNHFGTQLITHTSVIVQVFDMMNYKHHLITIEHVNKNYHKEIEQ